MSTVFNNGCLKEQLLLKYTKLCLFFFFNYNNYVANVYLYFSLHLIHAIIMSLMLGIIYKKNNKVSHIIFHLTKSEGVSFNTMSSLFMAGFSHVCQNMKHSYLYSLKLLQLYLLVNKMCIHRRLIIIFIFIFFSRPPPFSLHLILTLYLCLWYIVSHP